MITKKEFIKQLHSFGIKIQNNRIAVADIKKALAEESADIENTVAKMIADNNFLQAVPNMLSAAKSAIQVAQTQNKPDMIKFNTLVITYLTAAQKKDQASAVKAATDLVNAGFGEAFGLK